MRPTLTFGAGAFACALIAGATFPTAGFAGVMSVADKGLVSLPSPTDQVDWRSYRHRHQHWRPGWHWGRGPGARQWGYAPRRGYSRWGYAPRAGYSRWGYSRWGYSPRMGYQRARWGYSPRWGYGGVYGAACPPAASWGYNTGGAFGDLFGAAGTVAATPLWAAGSAVGATTDTLFGW